MRFSYAEAMTQATYYARLAQAAEAAGYTSMTVADSLIYPEDLSPSTPYTDTGDREFLEGKEFIETMILCAPFAHTSTLRLTPSVPSSPSARRCSSPGRPVAGLPVRGPARPGRRHLAVARGLRRWASRGSGAASGWTSAWTSCAG